MKMTGLQGVEGGCIENAVLFRSVTAGMRGLRESRAINAANDNGAVAVWKDDDGNYRCERAKWRMPQQEVTFKTKAHVRAWLAEQLPLIGADASA